MSAIAHARSASRQSPHGTWRGALVALVHRRGDRVRVAVRAVGSLTSGDEPVAGSPASRPEAHRRTRSTDRDRFRRPAATATAAPVDTWRPRPSRPTPGPSDTGPPTATNPAKVYIVGDSDAGTFGPYLETLLDGTNIVDTELNYKVSSGLARPDFFDWPAELAAKLPEVDPDIVVATFGGNDSQGLAVEDGDVHRVRSGVRRGGLDGGVPGARRRGDGPHGRQRRAR